MPQNVDGKFENNRKTQPRDLNSHPVFYRPSTKEMKEKMMWMHENLMEGGHMEMDHKMEKHMDMMNMGCGMMDMMMGSMCESATGLAAYLAPLAAAIAVAAF